MSKSRMLSARQATKETATCPTCKRVFGAKRTPGGYWFITRFCSRRCARRSWWQPPPTRQCAYCRMTFAARDDSVARRRKYCSKRCSDRASSYPHGVVKKNGYVYLNTGKAEVPVHRIAMERRLGRPLFATETVHHINGRRDDNRDENLELWDHAQPHGQRVPDKIAWCIEYLLAHGITSLPQRAT